MWEIREMDGFDSEFYKRIINQIHVKDYFSEDSEENLRLLADATMDDLTMILNRKAGRRYLDEMLKNLEDNEQLVIALFDINGLKWVNDTFGHSEGDRLLHYVATNMREELEDPDFIFRLSGDEFIIVFVGKEIYQAENWMKRMLQVLKKRRDQAGLEYEVSFCYGMSRVRGKEHLTVSDVLALADTQMYIQKRDYHIAQGKKRFLAEEKGEQWTPREMDYKRDYLFEALSDTVDGYVFVGKLKTGEFMYSRKMVREFGLKQQVLREAAAFWGEIVHPEDRELFLRSNQEVADGKTDRHAIRYRARNAKGEWVHLLCKGRMIRDAEGNPDIFAGVITNLDNKEMRKNLSGSGASAFYFIDEPTEQQRMEIESNLLEFVNGNIPGGILAVADDDEFSIQCFNQSLLKYLGDRTYEDLLQRTDGKFIRMIFEEDRERVLCGIKEQLHQHSIYKIYYRIEREYGKIAWVYDIGHYIQTENGKQLILSFLVDVTEEREQAQELRFINENTMSGVFKAVFDDKLQLTYANEGFYRMLGYTREQSEKEPEIVISEVVFPEDLDKIKTEMLRRASEREYQLTAEFRIHKCDGSLAWLHMAAGITELSDGKGVMIGSVMEITERHVLEEELYYTEQLYQLVQNYTNLKVWEYDYVCRRIRVQKIADGVSEIEKTIENVPQSIVQDNQVHPGSISEFNKLHEKMCSGADTAVATIRFVQQDGSDNWQKITYIAVKDEQGRKHKAIGIAEDVTLQKEAEIRAFNQEKMREIIEKDTLYSVHLNLDTHRVEMVWSDDNEMWCDRTEEVIYKNVFERIRETIANEDDRKRFSEEYSVERMQQYAKTDKLIKEFEFRQIYGNGIIIWVNLSFKIIISPTTGNKILFIYARNIDLAKRRELALKKKTEVDEVTGLYNLGTTMLLVDDAMKGAVQEAKESAFLLINIDNFKEVNHIGGFFTGDELLRQMASVLQRQLPPTAIAGRVNGDTFVVYFNSREPKKILRKNIQDLIEALSERYVCGQWKFDITVSGGAVVPGVRRMSYDTLYQRAYVALDSAKRKGGNCLEFYSDIQGGIEKTEEDGKGLAAVFRKGLNWIERGESRREVYRLLLKYMGKCYGAEEVTFFRRRREDDQLVREVGWNAYKKGATLEIEEKNLEKFNDVLRKSSSGREIYIDGKESPGYEEILRVYNADTLDYAVFLLGGYSQGRLMYGILVEKCDARVKDMAIREYIMDIIRSMEHIYNLREDYERALKEDQNTGVHNYESYEQRIEGLDEDTLTTFGMVGVQMVDLKKYNQQYGNIKGDECLVFAAEILSRTFGRSNCYRVGRTRFFAVCENMVYEEFIRRCETLKQEIEQNYSEWIVTANVWEKSSISTSQMQEQLEEKLTVVQNKKRSSGAISDKTVQEILQNIQKLTGDGSFCAFLQPKADANTEEICGAEALIRLRDEEKGVISPGSFLPAIERAGLIRHIDLFVLESVCKMICKWLKEGWKPFPISLNYSRATILEPDILEETNRIVERYGVPKELLEIEITESIGSIDNMSLKKIVEQFADSGYGIALDDYGAEYSNVYVLYSLRLNTLKLDRRIINDIYHDEKAKIVVENVIDVCKKFQIKSVAEGVETKEHLEVLREMSCDIIQGYYINKPLPEDEFYEKYISNM